LTAVVGSKFVFQSQGHLRPGTFLKDRAKFACPEVGNESPGDEASSGSETGRFPWLWVQLPWQLYLHMYNLCMYVTLIIDSR